MLKKSFIFALIFAGLALQSGNLAVSQSSNVKVKNETPKPNENKEQQNVEFEGVSFSYNPQIFGKVKAVEVAEYQLEDPTFKPDNVAPQHILFTLETPLERDATIAIYPIEDFRRVWAPVEKNNTFIFDEELKNLGKIIKNKNFRLKDEIPYLRWYDAHQTFNAKVKQFPFGSGKGVFFLTQIDIEPSLINNEGLTYIFQGLTDDGKKYVLAEFPVNLAFLPKNYSADEFENYKLPEFYKSDADRNRYKAYLSKTAKRLEKTPQIGFQPNLNTLEDLISTLKIKK